MKQWELRGFMLDDPVPTEVPRPTSRSRDVPHVLVEQLPIIVWTTDNVLEFTSSDGSELEELRLGANQIVGLTLFDLLDTDDPRHPVVATHLLALGGQTVSFDMHLAGRAFHARVSPLLDTHGEQIGTICAAVEDAGAEIEVVEVQPSLVRVE